MGDHAAGDGVYHGADVGAGEAFGEFNELVRQMRRDGLAIPAEAEGSAGRSCERF